MARCFSLLWTVAVLLICAPADARSDEPKENPSRCEQELSVRMQWLGSPRTRGWEILDLISALDPSLGATYLQPAGVFEKYILREHTLRVFKVFHRQFRHYDLQRLTGKKSQAEALALMRVMIALHDIGKPQAVAHGSTLLQHQFTLPVLDRVMESLGFNPEDRALAAALVGHDVLGRYVRGKMGLKRASTRLRSLALQAGLPLDHFFDLQMLFYVSDAASYPRVRKSAFRKLQGNDQWVLSTPRLQRLLLDLGLNPNRP